MEIGVLFPDEREKGDTPIRQCQLIMLRMLKVLDYLCNQHNVKYFLIGGGLLGAVRNKAFIPWDDDLDVGMTRDNYNAFIKYIVPEMPNDIFFQNPDTDAFYPQRNNVEARLRDKYSSYKHLNGTKNNWHEGIQIDIFVYDKAYLPFKSLIIMQNIILKKLNNKNKRSKVLQFISKYVPLPFVYASSYLQSRGGFKKNVIYIKENEISNLLKVEFEDMQVYIPQGFNNYLQRQFGNYTILPEIEDRVSPHKVQLCPFTPCNHNQILQWPKVKSNENSVTDLIS